jgi:hypothetical protein
VIRGIDFGGGGDAFAPAHGCDFRAGQRHRAAIAGGDRSDVDFPSGIRQADERAGAGHLSIIRMGQERECNAALG